MQFFRFDGRSSGVFRIGEVADHARCGHRFVQQLQSFSHDCSIEHVYACDIAARPIEASHQAKLHWVSTYGEHDRKRIGRRLGSKRSWSTNHYDHRDLAINEVNCQRWKAIELVLRPAIFDRYVLSLNITDFREAPPDGVYAAGIS